MAEQETVGKEVIECLRCARVVAEGELGTHQYSCPACGLELAHLERAPNGTVRRVLAWLRRPGDVLHGRYRVTRLLGRGGFAATYLADDSNVVGRRVAVKEIPAPLYDEEEVRILTTVSHPAVPGVTDRFEVGELVYVVLDFGGNRTLESERRQHDGKVAAQAAVQWMQQVCEALVYLHERTPPIIHRDLKPENILLDDSERVRLIDFGVAKSAAQQQRTRTIARAVSSGFSPPEQEEGLCTDQRSDVYSFGATLYVLLTGRVPPSAVRRLRGTALVPPRDIRPAIPEPLDRLILHALELNENSRPQGMREVREVLAHVAGLLREEAKRTEIPKPLKTEDNGNGEDKPKRTASSWVRVALLGTAVVGVIALAWLYGAREDTTTESTASSGLAEAGVGDEGQVAEDSGSSSGSATEAFEKARQEKTAAAYSEQGSRQAGTAGTGWRLEKLPAKRLP